jgi:hypothetical protein
MGILDNFEQWVDLGESPNLAAKIFSETVCKECSCNSESTPMKVTDNMGREVFWEDLGRP